MGKCQENFAPKIINLWRKIFPSRGGQGAGQSSSPLFLISNEVRRSPLEEHCLVPSRNRDSLATLGMRNNVMFRLAHAARLSMTNSEVQPPPVTATPCHPPPSKGAGLNPPPPNGGASPFIRGRLWEMRMRGFFASLRMTLDTNPHQSPAVTASPVDGGSLQRGSTQRGGMTNQFKTTSFKLSYFCMAARRTSSKLRRRSNVSSTSFFAVKMTDAP